MRPSRSPALDHRDLLLFLLFREGTTAEPDRDHPGNPGSLRDPEPDMADPTRIRTQMNHSSSGVFGRAKPNNLTGHNNSLVFPDPEALHS